MKMLNPSYNDDDLSLKYQYYIETVCTFNGTREQLLEILKIYGKELQEYILKNQNLIDVVMQEERIHRHDLNIDEEIDFNKVLESLVTNQELNFYEERAQHVLLLEAMNMFNTYGMDALRSQATIIKKEMEYMV